MRKLIIEIDDNVKNKFKGKVSKKGKTMKEVLTELIKKYLRSGI